MEAGTCAVDRRDGDGAGTGIQMAALGDMKEGEGAGPATEETVGEGKGAF